MTSAPQSNLLLPQPILTTTPIPISSPLPAFALSPQPQPVISPIAPVTVPTVDTSALLRNLMDSGFWGGSTASVGTVLPGPAAPATSVGAFGTPPPQVLTPLMVNQTLPQSSHLPMEEIRTMTLKDLGRIELSNKDLQM